MEIDKVDYPRLGDIEIDAENNIYELLPARDGCSKCAGHPALLWIRYGTGFDVGQEICHSCFN